MSDPTSSRRRGRKRPWLAALLAVVYPGLGHVYLRKWGRALLWFGVIIVTGTVLLPDNAVPETLSVDAFLAASRAVPIWISFVVLSLTLLSMADAYWLARQSGEETAATEADVATKTCPNCGKELDEDIDFCHWCTTRLDDEDA